MSQKSTYNREDGGNIECCIYGLYDKNGRLRYIGKADNPGKRLKTHMRDMNKRKTPLYSWLRKHGTPEMRVLESGLVNWIEAERRLIAEARERGELLLNVADGGDQPKCSVEVRKQNAKIMQHHPNTVEQRRRNGKWLNDPEREQKNKDGSQISRTGIIKDTYEWVLNRALKFGLVDLAMKTAKEMGLKYEKDKENFHFWEKFAK